MLTEYITKMYEENEKRISSLQREMDEIVTDINNAQTMMERLQYEKKLDTNIFSPRKIDVKADEKINECRIKIKGMNQRMEYVSQMVEECLNNRNELKVLLQEVLEKDQKEQKTQKVQTFSSLQENSDKNNDSLNLDSAGGSGLVFINTEKASFEKIKESIADDDFDKLHLSDANVIKNLNEDIMTDNVSENKHENLNLLNHTSDYETEEKPGTLSSSKSKEQSGIISDSKPEKLLGTLLDSKPETFPGTPSDNSTKNMPGTPPEHRLIEISEKASDISSDNRVEIVNGKADEKYQNSNTFLNLCENDEIAALNREDIQIQKEENIKKNLLSFLNDLYKHNEIALALVSGNRNKCKSEIRNSMSMIRNYAKKVENGDF